MHASGAADEVLGYLNRFETFRNLEFIDSETPMIPEFDKTNVKKGNVIFFKSRDGMILQDIVVKANPKRVQCHRYTVPYAIITNVESDTSSVDQDLLPQLPQYNKSNVKKGDVIFFKDGDGTILQDTVVRANPKRAQCQTYGVPYGLITNIESK